MSSEFCFLEMVFSICYIDLNHSCGQTLFRNLIVLLEQCAKKKNIKKKKKQSCKKILGPIKRFDGDVVEYLKVMLLSLVHKSRAGQGRI